MNPWMPAARLIEDPLRYALGDSPCPKNACPIKYYHIKIVLSTRQIVLHALLDSRSRRK